jgi:hypothetical protein
LKDSEYDYLWVRQNQTSRTKKQAKIAVCKLRTAVFKVKMGGKLPGSATVKRGIPLATKNQPQIIADWVLKSVQICEIRGKESDHV